MHDGLGCLSGSPADVNCPVFASIRNTGTLFPGRMAGEPVAWNRATVSRLRPP